MAVDAVVIAGTMIHCIEEDFVKLFAMRDDIY